MMKIKIRKIEDWFAYYDIKNNKLIGIYTNEEGYQPKEKEKRANNKQIIAIFIGDILNMTPEEIKQSELNNKLMECSLNGFHQGIVMGLMAKSK